MSEEQEQVAVETPENTEQQPGAEPESGEETTEQQPAEQPAEEPEASGFQKRINKITADKYAFQRRAEAAEAELKTRSQQTEQQPTVKEEPTLEQFDYDEDKFRDAAIDYKVNQRFQDAQERVRQREAQLRQDKAASDFSKKVASSNVPDDYSQVINTLTATIPIQVDVVSAIQQAENGPELAYYLGQNLDVADNISRMSPVLAAMEIGKISVQLSAGKKTAKPASKAPHPVTPVKAGGATAKSIYDVNADVSLEDIAAAG